MRQERIWLHYFLENRCMHAICMTVSKSIWVTSVLFFKLNCLKRISRVWNDSFGRKYAIMRLIWQTVTTYLFHCYVWPAAAMIPRCFPFALVYVVGKYTYITVPGPLRLAAFVTRSSSSNNKKKNQYLRLSSIIFEYICTYKAGQNNKM